MNSSANPGKRLDELSQNSGQVLYANDDAFNAQLPDGGGANDGVYSSGDMLSTSGANAILPETITSSESRQMLKAVTEWAQAENYTPQPSDLAPMKKYMPRYLGFGSLGFSLGFVFIRRTFAPTSMINGVLGGLAGVGGGIKIADYLYSEALGREIIATPGAFGTQGRKFLSHLRSNGPNTTNPLLSDLSGRGAPNSPSTAANTSNKKLQWCPLPVANRPPNASATDLPKAD